MKFSSSPRIDAILKFVRPSHQLYDLCCDHGLIGLQALTQNLCSSVVFVDQSPSALNAVEQAVLSLDREMAARTRVQCIPAEQCLKSDSSSDFIIAGVGVRAMISILDNLFPNNLEGHRLILAPQQKSLPLRSYLRKRGFGLIDEMVMREKGRFREVIVIEQSGDSIALYGERFRERQDKDSKDFVVHLEDYYRTLRKE